MPRWLTLSRKGACKADFIFVAHACESLKEPIHGSDRKTSEHIPRMFAHQVVKSSLCMDSVIDFCAKKASFYADIETAFEFSRRRG